MDRAYTEVLSSDRLADVLFARMQSESPYELVALAVRRFRGLVPPDAVWRSGVAIFVRGEAKRGVKTVLLR